MQVTAIDGLRLGLFNGDFRSRRAPLQRPKRIYAPVLINIAPVHHHQMSPVIHQPAQLASNRIALKPGNIKDSKSKFHRLLDKTDVNQPMNQDLVPFSKLRKIIQTKSTDDSIYAPSSKLHRLFDKTERNYQNQDLIPFSNSNTNLQNKLESILNRNNVIDHRNNVDNRNFMPLSKLKRSDIFNRNNYNGHRNVIPFSNARRNNNFNRNLDLKKNLFTQMRRNDIHNRNKYFNSRDFMHNSNTRKKYMNNKNYSLNPTSSMQNILEHLKELARFKVMTLKRDIGGLKKIHRISEMFRNRKDKNNGIYDQTNDLFGSPSILNEVIMPSGGQNNPKFIRRLTDIIRKLIKVLQNIFQAQNGSKSGHFPFNLRQN